MEAIEKYLEEKGKKIGIICRVDRNGNEYDHHFYTCDDGKAEGAAWDLEIMKMEDITLWQADIQEARELGLKTIKDFYNY